MTNSVQIAIDILTALLTGGFLLFFIETMHIESDVKQKFKSIMNPFYHKLSLFTVFIAKVRTMIVLPKTVKGQDIQTLMSHIDKAGVVPQTSGRDIPFMNGAELAALCGKIYDVWWNMNECRKFNENISIQTNSSYDEAKSILADLFPKYDSTAINADMISKAASDFHKNFWEPVQHCTPNYEYFEKKAMLSRVLIFVAMGFSVLSLIAVMIWADSICPLIPCLLAIIAVVIFAVCIGIMAFLISLSNRLFRAA